MSKFRVSYYKHEFILWLCALPILSTAISLRSDQNFTFLFLTYSLISASDQLFLTTLLVSCLSEGFKFFVSYKVRTSNSAHDFLLQPLIGTTEIFWHALLFKNVFRKVPVVCKNCFSFGEAVVTASLVTFVMASLNLAFLNSVVPADDYFYLIMIFTLLVFICLLRRGYNNVVTANILLIFSQSAFVMHNGLWAMILQVTPTRQKIALLWVLLFMIMLAFVPKSPKTVVQKVTFRKYFHFFLALFVVPVAFFDVRFLATALFAATLMFVVLEFLRVRFSGFGVLRVVNSLFNQFKDGRDKGVYYISHVFLLFGSSLPIFSHVCLFGFGSFKNSQEFAADFVCSLSGIASVCIGDSFSSIIGVRFGKTKIFKSRKTLEGLIGGFIAMFVFQIFLFILCDRTFILRLTFNKLVRLLIPPLLTSIAEFFINDFDNLFLPITMYSLNLFADLYKVM